MGKSTLLRSIALDCCKDGFFDVLIWLTEESAKDYNFELNIQTKEKELLKKIHVVSELDFKDPPKDISSYLFLIEETIRESKCSVLFFDNFTTSKIIQSQGIKTEGILATQLRSLADKMEIALVVVAHTSKGSLKGPKYKLTADDVRGNATLVNTAQFVYVLQPIVDEVSRIDFVFVDKARGYPNHQKSFALKYDAQLRCYSRDKQIELDEVYKKISSANKLMRGKDDSNNSHTGKQSDSSWYRN
jgi:hypothetical protein